LTPPVVVTPPFAVKKRIPEPEEGQVVNGTVAVWKLKFPLESVVVVAKFVALLPYPVLPTSQRVTVAPTIG
jgi:hypothetical protein